MSELNSRHPHILMIGGGKGGTGKSVVALWALAYALDRGRPVTLYDGDYENTDVLKPAKKRGSIPVHAVDLRVRDGWMAMIDDIERARGEQLVVVNQPAGATRLFTENEAALRAVASNVGAQLTVAFALNRQRDSLEILRNMVDGLVKSEAVEPSGETRWSVVAIRNLYWGDAERFSRFNESQTRKSVDGVVDLPELYYRAMDKIVDHRLLPDDLDAVYTRTEKDKNGNVVAETVEPVFTIAEKSALNRFNRAAGAAIDAVLSVRETRARILKTDEQIAGGDK